MRQRNKENDVISRFVSGEAILLLDQHATLYSSSASSACFFSSSVVLSVQLFQNNNEAVNYLIMSVLFSVILT